MKDIVILYHAECPDGFGAAWAAHKKFGDSADYIAVHHNHPIPEGLKNKTIYLLDFAYPNKETKELIMNNKRVTDIDHHVSGEVAIKLTQDYSYAIDNSGSVLSWMYFHPQEPVPLMLKYIEDRDLWKFKIKDTDAICAFIDSSDFNFKKWNQLVLDIEDDSKREDYIAKGSIILKHEERLREELIEEGAKIVSFQGYDVYAVNAPYFFASHIGAALCKKKPPFAIIWSESKGNIHVSLRSDGTVDVSKMAAKFGGGGHKGSAGFDLPALKSFPWKEVEQ